MSLFEHKNYIDITFLSFLIATVLHMFVIDTFAGKHAKLYNFAFIKDML